ncbi:hypothetical protein [Wolbachia endosymbiont (group A) of Ennomos erosarius]|uniref:hypothetical protein n=1 Tax=Wolbachia endosymbiont (group A) of Ennomos erosarius TaxID=3066174 RepID=UPI003342A483
MVGELDLKELNQKINENSILPEVESKGAKFKKVKENVSGVNFDDALENFSNVREAKQGAREFFQNLAQIYRSEKVFDQKNRQEVKLKLGLHASEAAYHGFTYGVLSMNFKY